MNKGDIETLAVNAVVKQITLCNLLAPYISDKDKEPCWDGFIYIYQNAKKVIGCAVNRVAVQIKGTEKEDFSKETIKARVDIADLRSYLNVYGTLYFVVYISGPESKIYYVDFTPVRIKDILGRATEKQKTIGVELQELPQDIKEIESIVINFADHCKRQASFSDTKLVTMDELSKSEGDLCFSLFFSGHGIEDPFRAMLKYGAYLYLESDSFPIPQPVATIPMDPVFTETVSAPISVAGKKYYDYYKRTRTKERVIISIGESFSLTIDYKNKKYTTIKYKSSDHLRILARDLEFMLAFIDNSGFELEGSDFKYKATDSELEEFEISKQRDELHYYQKAVQALDCLNCKGDLDLSLLSTEHTRNLHHLVIAIIDKVPVKGLLPNLPRLVSMYVGDYKFALVFLPYENEVGTYLIRDLFEMKMEVFSLDENDEKYQVSQFVVLTSDDFLTVTNLRVDMILSSLMDMPPHPQFLIRVNLLLLEILRAFDMDRDRKDLLDLAFGMAKWLYESPSEDVLLKDLRLLNLYQTIIRDRELNKEEKNEIHQIITRQQDRPDFLIGAFLLLDLQEEAKREFMKLDEQAQDEFRKYPIYKLFEDRQVCDF